MKGFLRIGAIVFAAIGSSLAQERLGEITIVVHDESGATVEGAVVHCVNWDDRVTRGPLTKDEQGVTDAEGRVTFQKKTIGQVFARVQSGELGGWYRLHDSGEHPVVTLPIARGRTVLVEVMGRLAGVKVFADSCLLVGETDAAGRIDVPNYGVKYGTYAYDPSLTFIKEGYARESTSVHFDAQTVQMTLRRAVTVRGIVLGPDGKPRAGANVFGSGLIDGVETGKGGRFEISGVPIGVGYFGAHILEDGKEYRKNVRDVNLDDDTSISLQLEEVQQGMVRVRVVDAETSKPVMASILTENSPQFPFPDRQGVTREDGTFELQARADFPVWVGVQPASPTLYALNGVVAATYKEPLNEIVFKMAEGCAIRGQVLYADGNPVVQKQVMFEPMSDPYRAIWTQPDGRFSIPGLNGVGIRYKLSVTDEYGRAGVAEVGPLAKGEIRSEVSIRMPPATTPHVLRGTVVDKGGQPVPSARLMFRYLDNVDPAYINVTADDQGRFETPVVRSGRTELRVSKGLQIMHDQSSINLGTELKSAGFVEIDATRDSETKIVVASASPAALGMLRVMDESGKPLDANVESWGEHDRSNSQSRRGEGVYLLNQDLKPPCVIAVTKDGYQARVLFFLDVESMDGDGIDVKLKRGPYPIGTSVWSAVTGKPATDAAVKETLFAQRIRENERVYYEQAARPTDEERRAQQAASATPNAAMQYQRRVRVTDASGQPVTNLTVEAFHPGVPFLIGMYRSDNRAGQPHALTSAEGVYDRLDVNYHQLFLHAPGTGRVLYQRSWSEKPDEVDDVVLRPAASLEIFARGRNGKPAENATLSTPDAGWNQTAAIASTGPDGRLRLQDLAPGVHAFTSMVDATPQLVFVRLTDGEAKSVVIHATKSEEDPIALLAQYRKENRPQTDYPTRVDEEWYAQIEALGRGARGKLRNAVCSELEGLVGYEHIGLLRQELAMLTSLAVQLRAQKAIAPLQQLLKTISSDARLGPAMSLDSFVNVATAIADLGSDDVVASLARISADATVCRNGRVAALVGLGRIGSDKSVRAFAQLRDAGYALPNAPSKKEAYTHGELIVETCQMVFGVLSGDLSAAMPQASFTGIQVSEDYATATLSTTALGGGTSLAMKRAGDEWLVSGLGPTIMY